MKVWPFGVALREGEASNRVCHERRGEFQWPPAAGTTCYRKRVSLPDRHGLRSLIGWAHVSDMKGGLGVGVNGCSGLASLELPVPGFVFRPYRGDEDHNGMAAVRLGCATWDRIDAHSVVEGLPTRSASIS